VRNTPPILLRHHPPNYIPRNQPRPLFFLFTILVYGPTFLCLFSQRGLFSYSFYFTTFSGSRASADDSTSPFPLQDAGSMALEIQTLHFLRSRVVFEGTVLFFTECFLFIVILTGRAVQFGQCHPNLLWTSRTLLVFSLKLFPSLVLPNVVFLGLVIFVWNPVVCRFCAVFLSFDHDHFRY